MTLAFQLLSLAPDWMESLLFYGELQNNAAASLYF